MPASVVVTVLEGGLKGKTFRVEERAVLLVGKEEDCHLRFPHDKAHRVISRHHCLLDVNPPLVRVRDMGSRNGTFVNGRRIEKSGGEGTYSELDLQDGDEIRLGVTGKVLLRVEIQVPVTCFTCGVEVRQEKFSIATQRSAAAQCANCRRDTHGTVVEEQGSGGLKTCARCGKAITTGMRVAQGETLCPECTVHPSMVAQRIIDLAHGGEKRLESLGQFDIVREIGRGGMGLVYLARHRHTGAEAALKVLLPQGMPSKKASALFEREIALTRALDHPHIVKSFDSGQAAGAFYFTMEYCDGGSVDAVMKARRCALFPEEAIGFTRQILSGLEYAHAAIVPGVKADGVAGNARGLVHRDLKPQNLFLVQQGGYWLAKIGDFGLAKSFDFAGLSGLTYTGALAGTPHYMPRQQAIDFRFAKPEVDVWAAAACLYYMLTCQTPRRFLPDRDVFTTVLETDSVPIRTYLPDLPTRLAEVIDYALRDRPSIGFKTAREFRVALEAAI